MVSAKWMSTFVGISKWTVLVFVWNFLRWCVAGDCVRGPVCVALFPFSFFLFVFCYLLYIYIYISVDLFMRGQDNGTMNRACACVR